MVHERCVSHSMWKGIRPPPTRLNDHFLRILFSGTSILHWATDHFCPRDDVFWSGSFWCWADRFHPQIWQPDRRFPNHLFSESWNFNKIKFLSVWVILFRKVPIFVISAKNGFQAAPRKTFKDFGGFFEVPEITFWAKPLSLRQFGAPKRSQKSRKSGKSLKVF